MKIAYISADFGVPIFGCKGASVHVRELVVALANLGHRICLISPALEKGQEGMNGLTGAETEGNSNNIELFRVTQKEEHLRLFQELMGLDEFLDRGTRIRQELRNILYNQTLYSHVLDSLRSRNVDCIYERYTLFSYAGIQLARDLKVPHILEVNAPLAYEQEKRRGLEMKDMARDSERRIFQHTNQVIVVSAHLKQFVESCGVPESRIRILPNSVDPGRFTPTSMNNSQAVRSRYGLGDKKVIGFVGSLKAWHGTETLLDAFQELHPTASDTHLLIVGDGPGREDLESRVRQSGLDSAVTFTGSVGYDDIPDYIGAMDITVAPYVPNENFYYSPIKIFEYMAMAKPVVAGKIGQCEEMITDGETGLLFEPGKIDQLTAALSKLVTDQKLCQRIGEKSRAWVTHERTWRNNAQGVIQMANELTAKSGTPKSD